MPLENRGGGNCPFLSIADGARKLSLLANVTGASLRKMIVGFIANESARKIGTTTLEREVRDLFSLSVPDYAEEMAESCDSPSPAEASAGTWRLQQASWLWAKGRHLTPRQPTALKTQASTVAPSSAGRR